MSENGDNFWTLLSSLAWPGAILVGAALFRDQIKSGADAALSWANRASEVKIGSVELRGLRVDVSEAELKKSSDIARVKASIEDYQERVQLYRSIRNLMLVHRIRPSSVKGQKFDISVYIVRKVTKTSKAGRLNDVDRVEYYLGQWFGEGEFGSKYVVSDPSFGFAMRTSAYGSALCIAKIHFHDGKVSTLSRYLDFEMGTNDNSGNDLVYPDRVRSGVNKE